MFAEHRKKLCLILGLMFVSLFLLMSGCSAAEYTDATSAEADTFTGFREENGGTRYYVNGKAQIGWLQIDGKCYYATYSDRMLVTYDKVIGGKFYKWNDETGLQVVSGFVETADGTICYENGVQVTGWRHKDGSGVTVTDGISEQYDVEINGLYYFLYSSGLMVTDKTYRLGGFVREFNEDHTVKPVNGLQSPDGELYYYDEGVIQLGWQTVNGNTYYFRASDDVYGRAATRWTFIENQIYYFCASTSDTPYALKTSGTIGGAEYTYDSTGRILYNGFINCQFVNSTSNNSPENLRKMNSATRYYIDGEMQTGWQKIGDNHYYFFILGSANGEGYMCCESRMIGDVYREFSPTGELTSAPPEEKPDTPVTPDKPDVPEEKLPDNLVIVADQTPGNYGVAVIDLSKIDLSNYDSENNYCLIPKEAEIFRFSDVNDVAGIKVRYSEVFGSYVILISHGIGYATIVSYPDGEVLFETDATGRGPHSVELLPEGWLVVAAPGYRENSYNDGSLTFFCADPATGSSSCRYTVTLANAHGVLYDPEGDCIWAVGNNVLKKYSYTITNNRISVTEELSRTIPADDAHDLAAYYGDTNKLLITTKTAVYVYNKETDTFTTAKKDSSLPTAKKIKGYGLLGDGSVVYVKPGAVGKDSVSQTWLTDCIYYYKKTADGFVQYRLISPDSEYYKIRVMRAEYQ